MSFSPNLPSLPSYPPSTQPTRRIAQPRGGHPSASTAPIFSTRPRAPSRASFAPSTFSSNYNSSAPSTFSHHSPPPSTPSASPAAHVPLVRLSPNVNIAPRAGSRKRALSRTNTDNTPLDAFGYPISDSRLRNQVDHDEEDDGRIEQPAAKRRIIDVVSTVAGGVLRGAWNLLPRVPFFGGAAETSQQQEIGSVPESSEFNAPPPPPRMEEEMPLPAPGHRVLGQPPPLSSSIYHPSLDTDSPTARWVAVHAHPMSPPSTTSTGSSSNGGGGRRRAGSIASTTTASRYRRPASPKKKKRGISVVSRKKAAAHRASTGRIGAGGLGGEEDEEEDDELRRFNERLKNMIREGKEALGARVEVEYEGGEIDEDMDMGGYGIGRGGGGGGKRFRGEAAGWG